MIDWVETEKQFQSKEDTKGDDKVIIICERCNKSRSAVYRGIKKKTEHICTGCRNREFTSDPEYKKKMSEITKESSKKRDKSYYNDEDYKQKMSNKIKEKWQDKNYKEIQQDIHSDQRYLDKIANSVSESFTDDRKKKYSNRSKKFWQDDEYRTKNLDSRNDEYKRKLSETTKRCWKDQAYRDNYSNVIKQKLQTAEYRQKLSETSKKKWQNKNYRSKMSKIMLKRWGDGTYKEHISSCMKEQWQDPEYCEKMMTILANMPKVSSLATTFYSLLDDIGIDNYGREYNDQPDDPRCKVGEYTFDCFIPRENDRDLLIDVNGNWVHSLPEVIRKDKAKASYIANNWSHLYEYKYIWEHDLACYNKVVELVKYWMGITKIELVDFSFKDVEIKRSKADEYKLLLAKYHYLPNAGRGGKAYGAYLGDELIAVCVFSHPIRQNVALSLNVSNNEVRELSRLCIHPRYQKKNFASWFMSKCIRKLDNRYKLIVSYCDTTFNHDGKIYKAANFIKDKVIPPDYWYAKEDGWVMHKRTLYGKAVDMKMTESQFASKFGYRRIYGKEKYRFIYKR